MGIKSLIEVSWSLGLSMDTVIQDLMEKNGLSQEDALEKNKKILGGIAQNPPPKCSSV